MLVEIVVFRTGRSVVRVEQEQEKALKIFQTFSVMFKDLNQRLVFLRPNLMNKKKVAELPTAFNSRIQSERFMKI